MRTTLDLDSSVLRQLKERQREQNKTLGQLVSELLARALADTAPASEPAPLEWTVHPMRARVDLEDRDAVQRLLDADR
ncbi:MAG: antitoxin [Pseudonocardiaceae bacterium]|nr:antitoxin [Pseudonocardiaceae bacterium]